MYKTICRLITLIMATKRISSHLILHRYVLIINRTYLQLSWCSHECVSNFLQHSSYTISLKRGYRHLHGAVREYVINLKEKPQVSMSHLDSAVDNALLILNWRQTQPLPIPPHLRTWMSPRILYSILNSPPLWNGDLRWGSPPPPCSEGVLW